jgi:outer membrane protein TolC
MRLSLTQAVGIAVSKSKALAIASQSLRKAGGKVGEAKAVTHPTATAAITGTRLDKGTTVKLNDADVPITVQNQIGVTVQAALPLDVAGQIRAALSIAEFLDLVAKLDVARIRNGVVADVRSAYLDVLRARAFVTVAEQALKNSKERSSTAQAYLKAGTGTRFDTLRAETDVANSEQVLISARNRVDLAVAALNNAMGQDQNTPLELEDAKVGDTKADPDPLAKAMQEAYDRRPEALQVDLQIKAADKGLILADRSVMPTFGLGWNLSFNPNVGALGRSTSWAAVASVSLPLFDGGLARSRKVQAQSDAASIRIVKQQVLDGVALEVRSAYLGWVEAGERMKVTGAALVQAEEQYRLAQVRFRNGVTLMPGASPLLEVSDAQTALTQAQANRINAEYDLLGSQTKLQRALGRYAYEREPARAAGR